MPTYLVTDIEANGLVPGRHSMISIASVAVDHSGAELGQFTANLTPVDGHSSEPGTMAWWSTQPDAWREATADPVEASIAVNRFVAWAQELPGPRIFTAHPLHFDGAYIAWYLDQFADLPLYDSPHETGLAAGGIDLPSLVMGVIGWTFDRCGRHSYPDAWLGGHAHSHRAIDDALGYAALLKTMLEKLEKQSPEV